MVQEAKFLGITLRSRGVEAVIEVFINQEKVMAIIVTVIVKNLR
jgi:hypothetical protein